MRISLLGGAAVAALIALGSAQAADLGPRPAPVYKAPAMVPTCVWCGFYIGGEVGAAWGTDRINDVNGLNGPTPAYDLKDTAVIGNGEIGYNWQAQQFVFGLEGNFGGIGFNKTVNEPTSFNGTTFVTTNHLGSGFYADVTGRLGIAAGDALFYGKGGYAFYDGKANVNNTLGGFGGGVVTTGAFTSGWTAGGGIEYMFLPNWSAKLEYLHFDFGSQTATLVTPANGNFAFTNKLTAETLQVGLNYHFH